ncbi:hypothetical protein [Romboutsia lituseburensis]|uniref:hypothetical protein n=1 Tax=Romboutsia lituseburensis TaxID=1537 RepID=UPI00215AE8C4|nr:hypothetical protein [Romboutsia lituseburensis]MCR8744499.1 hypothetical protein [Romboutsia lituseburensis]
MINRIIYSNKVYYKVKDLVEMYDNKFSLYKIKKVMKEQGIATTKLKGYGNALFIEETNIAMIEIDGAITVMETKFKDRKQELKSEISRMSLFNCMFTGKLPKKTDEELFKEVMTKTDETMEKDIDIKMDNDDFENECIEFNSEIKGHQECKIGFSYLIKNENEKIEKKVISLLVNSDDEVIADGSSISYYKEENRIVSEYLEESIIPTIGEPKVRAKKDIIEFILNFINNSEYESEHYEDYIEFKCQEIGMSIKSYDVVGILRGDIKIINVFGDNSEDIIDGVIDVEYVDIEDYTKEYEFKEFVNKVTNDAIEQCNKVVSNMFNKEENYIDVKYTEVEEQEIMRQGLEIAENILGEDVVEVINNLDEEETEVEYKNIYEKIKARAERNKRKFREEQERRSFDIPLDLRNIYVEDDDIG